MLSRLFGRKARAPQAPRPRRAPRLSLTELEDREVPALTIQLDYTYDGGFFSDPATQQVRRAALQQAATDLQTRINTSLAAITPSGTNTWVPVMLDPSNPDHGTIAFNNPTIPADTMIVYVGGSDLAFPNLAESRPGSIQQVTGSASWITTTTTRGHSGFSPYDWSAGASPWGGSISFDNNGPTWYFGSSAAVPAGQQDFYSAAVHELGHVLGIGLAPQWKDKIVSDNFTGTEVKAVYGGSVPVSTDANGNKAHWVDGTTINGARASMNPTEPTGTRVAFSSLDFAALKDIGWSVNPTFTSSVPVTPLGINHVVAVADDRLVYESQYNGTNWTPYTRVPGISVRFSPSEKLTAVDLGGGQWGLYAVGTDGMIHGDTFNGTTWASDFTAIGSAVFSPNAQLAPTVSGGLPALYGVDVSGQIEQAWTPGGGTWYVGPIPNTIVFASAAPLVATLYNGQTSVYGVDTFGQVEQAWTTNGTWHVGPLPNSVVFPSAAPLTVTQNGVYTSLYGVSTSGQIEQVWTPGGGTWYVGPLPGTSGLYAPGTPLVATLSNGQTSVYGVDAYGQVEQSWTTDGNWHTGPLPNTVGLYAPGTRLSAFASGTYTALYAVGVNTHVDQVWTPGNGTWYAGPIL
jgi:hypothetical protein